MTGEAAGQSIDLLISGMTCAACVGRVERAIRKIGPEVASVEVNLAFEQARVQLATPLPAERLVQAVRDAGYEAAVATPDAPPPEPPPADRTWLWSAALTAPLVLPMLAMPFGIHWMLPAWIQFLLATPVQVLAGARFYKAGWAALRARSGNMDLLIALGTSSAYGLSLYEWWAASQHGHEPHLYFEASATIITLVLLGKWLEMRARRKAVEAIRSLQALRPEVATVITAEGPVSRPIARVRVGDRVQVLPGERVPVDGLVIEGESEVDESLLTGESALLPRGPGTTVAAGAINGNGRLVVETRAIGADSTLARIIRLVEDAQAGKAPIQRLADQVSAVFVPVVVVIAFVTLAAWWFSGASGAEALLHAVAVLVIACPCALGLATPAAIMAGTGVAARHGILIRDAEALERAQGLRRIAFDKTGTLTEGHPKLTAHRSMSSGVDALEVLRRAAALQQGSEHPLALAVREAAQGQVLPEVSALTAVPGQGVEGLLDGRRHWLGNARLMVRAGLTEPHEPADLSTHTIAWLAGQTENGAVALLGVLAFSDPLRAGAREAVQALKDQGIEVWVLSGDRQTVAEAVLAPLALDGIRAGLLPADKLAVLRGWQSQGLSVGMVGDGINDAPALAAAQVAFAMGSGTDVARQAASVTLMSSDPRRVADAVSISRQTWRKIRQNLFWAFAFNALGIPAAALGYLSPVLAGAAMAFSSVTVVTNALLLKRWRPGK